MGSQRVRHDWSSSLRRDLVKKSYGTFILYNSTQQQSRMMWAHVCGDSYSGNCILISQYLGALVPGTLFHSIQNSADAQVPYIKWHSRGGPLWMNPWMQWANCKWGQTYSMEHEDLMSGHTLNSQLWVFDSITPTLGQEASIPGSLLCLLPEKLVICWPMWCMGVKETLEFLWGTLWSSLKVSFIKKKKCLV